MRELRSVREQLASLEIAVEQMAAERERQAAPPR
jgi:hypothetical protein